MNSALEILKTSFGYGAFRPGQEEIIQTVLSGQDAFVLMPTGGGKSLCYQIPALALPGITLVISPLISLMKDQVDTLKMHGIQAEFLNSALSQREADRIEIAAREGKIKLLYLSPEKCISAMNWLIQRLPVGLVAIDEAHCVSNWGHDFRPEYKQLSELRQVHPNAVMMALTATADKLTRQDILTYIGLKDPRTFITSFDRPNIRLNVRFGLRKKEKLEEIMNMIRRHKDQSGIIYCTAKKTTEALALELKSLGVKAAFYHAGMGASDRNRIQEQFLNDEIDVVCATIAFGMGIDKSNVRYVMHYNLPKSIESFYQEIGRGGRDGGKCDTLLFYSIGDVILLSDFAKNSGLPEINLEKLNRMQEYAEARICRRKILLNYFGENLQEDCGNCDVCSDPPQKFDGTTYCQMALSAIVRANGINAHPAISLLINILRGSRNAEILQKKLNTIKTHGVGKAVGYDDWSYYILQMIQLGLLEIQYDHHNALAVTEFGAEVLSNKHTISLVKYVPKQEEEEEEDIFYKDKFNRSLTRYQEEIELEFARQRVVMSTLKIIRKQIAERENVPPYIIFHDTTLNEMVEKSPMTEHELLQISGVSQSKFDKYGTEFLNAIIASNPAHRRYSSMSVYEATQPEYITKCVEEMQQQGISVSATAVAKLMLASEDKRFQDIGKKVSFFGVLGGEKLGVKALYEKLKNTVAPLQEKAKAVQIDEVASKVRDYLTSVSQEALDEQKTIDFKHRLALIDQDLPALRKHENPEWPPRSGQKWTADEKSILMEMTRYTSDISKMATIIQRTERSVIFMLDQMIIQAAAISE
jgi:ATP-dependent DNA helicase RecQ